MNATPEQFNQLAGEPEIELTIPLGLDQKPVRHQTKRRHHPTAAELRREERRRSGFMVLGAVIYLTAVLTGGALIIG